MQDSPAHPRILFPMTQEPFFTEVQGTGTQDIDLNLSALFDTRYHNVEQLRFCTALIVCCIASPGSCFKMGPLIDLWESHDCQHSSSKTKKRVLLLGRMPEFDVSQTVPGMGTTITRNLEARQPGSRSPPPKFVTPCSRLISWVSWGTFATQAGYQSQMNILKAISSQSAVFTRPLDAERIGI